MPCIRSEGAAPTGAHLDRDFSLPGDRAHYPPDRPFDVRHVALDVTVDFAAKALRGTCATTASVLFDEIREVVLQASEMRIASVEFTSKRRPNPIALEWEYDGHRLRAQLDRPLHFGAEFTLKVGYETNPRVGMSFVGPSAGDPDRAVQAHTQGQPEYAHYWFPCHDSPNDRATMSVAARVPTGFFAVSNGRLEGVDEHPDGARTFRWHESVPFPAYIATLAVGEFSEIRERFGETPVLYYARPGFEDHARRMMGDTPAMLEYYSTRFGIRYPYEKYAQVILEEFTGAMENTSATSHTWLLLPDERSFIDWEGKSVVAHELVHQWFGDLLTCRDWSHAWLNESFATYFEETFKQADPAQGELEFRLGMRNNQHFYLDEDRRYRRSIVYNVYHHDGQELFDRHLYEKGSCVLHMLRAIVGETAFWRAIQAYARANRGREVITADLERAFEEATGKSMGRFFAQWVYHGGHPDFEVSYDWDGDHQLAKVTVKQTQKVDELTPLFATPVQIAFTLEHRGRRETKTFTVHVENESETFVFPLDRRPVLVRFDPYGWVLKTLKFDRTAPMLRWQIANDVDPLGRLEAAEALAKESDAESVQALVTALNSDEFWAVRAEAARSLAEIGNEAALRALVAALGVVKHPKARRAVAEALGTFHAPERQVEAETAARALTTLLDRGDSSYLVEAAAATSLGKTRTGGAYQTLVKLLDRPSWHDLVAKGAQMGLGELATPEAAETLARWLTDRAKPMLTRDGAAAALRALIGTGRLERDSAAHIAVREALLAALDDPWERVRAFAASALGALDDASVIPALERAIGREVVSGPQRLLRVAVASLRRGKRTDAEVRRVRRELDELREEQRKLRDRLVVFEAQASIGANGKANGVKAGAHADDN